MLIKNKLHLLPFFLISCLGLLFITSNNQVMAMENNNKGKTIINHEPSEKEVNDFFQLSKRTKENICYIRQTIPHLKNASVREIEEWICSPNKQKTKNKRLKTIDLNKKPEQN
ncbi:putative secreted protein [Candidatus Phytoplasma luffae]|uniref:Secreted protein n=1 Tax=Loofah witches'-broom phytoplasma TaxID=35773 RepID=A0A975FK89_LOWBP|nr:SVM family protein [Candidatus Phytoplasma luffae]QTX02923.1 putative secreted protein [Candidatus Phytoplasma luffae]QTX02978.1 putative secreted protein [Candidatus Phytoplasma luffae]